MSIVQQVVTFFEILFHSNKPEVQKKIKLKNIETSLKQIQPAIYKNDQLLPRIGQAFFMLYKETKRLEPYIFLLTGETESTAKETLYTALIKTGYTGELSKKVRILSYEDKKKRLFAAAKPQVEIEFQRRNTEEYLKYLQTPSFKRIEETLQNLDLFVSLCNFNYINCVHLFNPDWIPQTAEAPLLNPIDINQAETVLQDFYFISSSLRIDAATARALLAALRCQKREPVSAEISKEVTDSFQKIAAILHQIISEKTLINLLKLIKQDPEYTPRTVNSKKSYLHDFAEKTKRKSFAEEKRLNSELQDTKITSKIKALFSEQPLSELEGYNHETNSFLLENSSASFLWITPMQILKTFMQLYYDDIIDGLLNDIVVEGFFINPNYKSNYSSTVYTCSASTEKIKEFEKKFDREGKFSTALLQGYIKDSQKDAEFAKTLQKLVDTINKSAKEFIQQATTNLSELYIQTKQLIDDSKKTSPEEVENIKVLLSSSRNRDKTEFLERTLPKWQHFIDIMKNYAIITPQDVQRNE